MDVGSGIGDRGSRDGVWRRTIIKLSVLTRCNERGRSMRAELRTILVNDPTRNGCTGCYYCFGMLLRVLGVRCVCFVCALCVV